MFSEQFPQGDRGGNLDLIRIRSSPVQLHAFWDGLLGREISFSSIGKDVDQIQKILREFPELTQNELESHKSVESWALESFELAKKVAYLDGQLKVANTNNGTNKGDPPTAPDDYASNAGRTARVQIGKAALRLAEVVSEALIAPAVPETDEGRAEAITPAEAIKKIGEKVTVKMEVKSVGRGQSGVYFLNSEDNFRTESNLTLFISNTVAPKFKQAGIDDPAEHFKGKKIQANGTVKLYRNRPEIVIEDPKQLVEEK
jgi:hypothetical protein